MISHWYNFETHHDGNMDIFLHSIQVFRMMTYKEATVFRRSYLIRTQPALSRRHGVRMRAKVEITRGLLTASLGLGHDLRVEVRCVRTRVAECHFSP